MVGTNIVLGAGPRGTRPITNAFGREADIQVLSVLSVSPQGRWAKNT